MSSTERKDSSTSPSGSSHRTGDPTASSNPTSDESAYRVSRTNSSAQPESKPDIKPYPLDDPDLSPSHSTNPPPTNSPSPHPPTTPPTPSSHFVDPLLTDLYELTMAYAYYRQDKHNDIAVFDLFFRDPPFGGEFCVFAGLEEVLRFVVCWRFTAEHIDALRKRYPDWVDEFWEWLGGVTLRGLKIYAIEEGTVVVGRVPLIRVEGPLALCQLMETTFLVLVNYASLLTTNAARHRLAVGPHKTLLEFGLRRAQGPDGAMSASKYAYVGGFDGTSNVKAALLYGIPCMGTHAHSFVSSFLSMDQLHSRTLPAHPSLSTPPPSNDFVSAVLSYRSALSRPSTNQSELAAFIAYAQSFPTAFLALVDTYDVLESGVWNFLFVALALDDWGYRARGIRLDSGDLAYLSRTCRALFRTVGEKYGRAHMAGLTIVASNDLSENVLYSLREQGHEIDTFAVGTHLVTCKAQPALGCVYKLVSINERPRIKVSHDAAKITIPGRKDCYRLYGQSGEPIVDLLLLSSNSPPLPGKRILCRHPFDANKRVYVTPSRVVLLHQLVWDGEVGLVNPFPSLTELRHRVQRELSQWREDHLRRLNPTPYKLSVTSDLYTFMHDLWLSETPIAEIR